MNSKRIGPLVLTSDRANQNLAPNAAAGTAAVRLRAASEGDWPMVRRWLAQPEVIRWWGPKATTEAEVMLAMAAGHAVCRVIEAREEPGGGWQPAGYAHALDASAHGEPLPANVPAGAWGIELFVAAPQFRGRGIGAQALQLIREEVFSSTLCLALFVRVGISNENTVRAYECAGFVWRTIVHDYTKGPAWVMVSERRAG